MEERLADSFAPNDEPIIDHPDSDEYLLDAYSRAVVNVVDTVGPAVVSIRVRKASQGRRPEGEGAGSGVILVVSQFTRHVRGCSEFRMFGHSLYRTSESTSGRPGKLPSFLRTARIISKSSASAKPLIEHLFSTFIMRSR